MNKLHTTKRAQSTVQQCLTKTDYYLQQLKLAKTQTKKAYYTEKIRKLRQLIQQQMIGL